MYLIINTDDTGYDKIIGDYDTIAELNKALEKFEPARHCKNVYVIEGKRISITTKQKEIKIATEHLFVED